MASDFIIYQKIASGWKLFIPQIKHYHTGFLSVVVVVVAGAVVPSTIILDFFKCCCCCCRGCGTINYHTGLLSVVVGVVGAVVPITVSVVVVAGAVVSITKCCCSRGCGTNNCKYC